MTPSPHDHAPDVRRWLPAVYAIAVIYCLVPFIETFGALWPPQFDSPTWRYGAVGIFLTYVPSIPLGLIIASGVARALGHRPVLRAIGVASILLALVVVVVIGSFALDVVQVRTIVRDAVKGGFDVAAGKAALMGLIVMVTAVLLAISSFRAAAGDAGGRRSTKRHASRSPDLVVGKPTKPVER